VLDAPVAERPAAPAPLAADPLDPESLEELLLEDLLVPLPDTTSPTWPESETIVPSSGAKSLVFWTASSSLCTVNLSLLTFARAEAMFASRVAALSAWLCEALRQDQPVREDAVAEIARLSPRQRRGAGRYPHALPLVLAEPDGVTALCERWSDDSAALEDASAQLGLSPVFLGAVVLALVGTVSDLFAAVVFARQDKMDIVFTICIGSAIQTALVMAPVLVLASWFIGQPMNLVFSSPLDLFAIAGAAFIVRSVAADGETTWFEGVQLLALYAVVGVLFFVA